VSRTDAPTRSRRQLTATLLLNSEVSPVASTLTVFEPVTAVAIAEATRPGGAANATSAANDVMLARHAAAEPLTAIAADLNLPNNTIQQAVRRARNQARIAVDTRAA
jgi:hypothetical protein